MSVLLVFGSNLRKLTALRGSQTAVANDLDISRVQFQRYLRSESFPKPNMLKRICDYFGVDARILTDPLSEEQLQLAKAGQYEAKIPAAGTTVMQQAISYCAIDQNYFEPSQELRDGIYSAWRGSYSRPGCAVRQMVQIKTLGLARVVNGFDPRELYPEHMKVTGRMREFRGVVLRPEVGFVILYFHADPSRYVSMEHLEHVMVGHTPALAGTIFLGRGAHAKQRRMARTFMSRLPDDWSVVMQVARRPMFVDMADVPASVLPFIEPSPETF
ncbi:hypothetical protein CUV01_01510 [Paracoccus tegillarcae]|uniref:HTH cro/C1-type domain-containing protein n=2 Tax=Paracoccus tegillarcae TaxID=1529068 RepID=A0A2K9ED85_9RHOB|nr:hypothetical protein CUV01_01510 [Paracoccus tegillarcae]